MHQELSTAPAKRRRFSPVLLLMWVLILGLGAGLGYMVWINQGLRTPAGQAKLTEQLTQAVVDKVAAILLVPADETPTVAQIDDPDKLRQEDAAFYADAKKGDYILLYKTRAVLYRESENKIIKEAPIVAPPEPASVPSPTNTTPVDNSTKQP